MSSTRCRVAGMVRYDIRYDVREARGQKKKQRGIKKNQNRRVYLDKMILGLARIMGAGEARRTAPLPAQSRGLVPGDSRRNSLLLARGVMPRCKVHKVTPRGEAAKFCPSL